MNLELKLHNEILLNTDLRAEIDILRNEALDLREEISQLHIAGAKAKAIIRNAICDDCETYVNLYFSRPDFHYMMSHLEDV